MAKMFLIGGGPGSGKSTVAQALAKKHGLEYLKCDELVGEHQEKAAEQRYPVNLELSRVSDDDRPLTLIGLDSKKETARQRELFFILLKYLRSVHSDRMIIEGNCLLPDLVKERFEYPYEAIWLVPTLEFQKELYAKRPWAKDLLKQSGDATGTLKKWIERDHKFNEMVMQEAEKHRFAYKCVDGQEDIKQVEAWAEEHLSLV